jgi:hypothetical protein
MKYHSSSKSSDVYQSSSNQNKSLDEIISSLTPEILEADSLGSSQCSDRMMQAIQAQRDRFMKATKDKEQELVLLRSRLERLHDEQLQLRAENIELYKRLRMLRSNLRGNPHMQLLGEKKKAMPSKHKGGRKDVHQDDFSITADSSFLESDDLENKYSMLYEQQIDPFKFEELDRQVVLSKMNVLERGLAAIIRFFMQDQWARHALLVYLLLVHILASCYVLQVLNPEMIDEMNARWDIKYLGVSIEREHPDLV